MPAGGNERRVETAAAADEAQHAAGHEDAAPSGVAPGDAIGKPRGTDTWVQAADASGQVRADKEVPEPDSLGG
jgi:hypothetical protein